ncbi:hypothetical protein [Spirillospora sp. CA-294931]|uniref:hypothetical protein n=1 Tax=Spirillospora sp. CA-294931 TaxID=3240042 RepID=UPI003D8A613E
MRAINSNNPENTPFNKKAKRNKKDVRAASFGHNNARNARQMPTRRLQRGR